MGFPGAHTHVPTEPGNDKSPKISEATRWASVANSWHVPCLRFGALCILVSTGVQTSTAEFAATNLYLPWAGLAGDLPGPDLFTHLHGLRGPAFVQKYLACLDPRITNIANDYASLYDPPSSDLNPFSAYRRRAGFGKFGLWQPGLLEAESRAAIQAAADSQTGYHLARDAIPRLVPHGMGPLQHVESAISLNALPFGSPRPLCPGQPNMPLAPQEGSNIRDLRSLEIRRLRRKAKQLRPLNEKLLGLMPEDVYRISKDTHVAFILYAMILMGWPDAEYLNGFLSDFLSQAVWIGRRPLGPPVHSHRFRAERTCYETARLTWTNSSVPWGRRATLQRTPHF